MKSLLNYTLPLLTLNGPSKVVNGLGLVYLLLFLGSCGDVDEAQVLPKVVDFNFHIKPILSDRCFACHGPDKNTREAELELHTESGLFALLDSSSESYVIRPGDLVHSEFFQRISSDDPEYVMPPPNSHLSVSSYEKDLIKKWIEQGAQWKDHWSFIPPVKPEVPDATQNGFTANDIDRFVLQKLKNQKLNPSDVESPGKLLRRVYFDLVGLPPPLEIIREFEANPTDSAYVNIVDELLDSPQYGERMASTWLDLARYADSHGYQDDRPRTIWPWRDWVIDAFNDNLSYKDFATWQIAGDLLPEATYSQKLATAFNRNHPITQEGGVIAEEYLTEYAADRLQTFSTAFLGLTLQCARCHDHKYDPLSQEEFYEMMGFFNNVAEERGQISYFDLAPEPNIQMLDSNYEGRIEEIKDHILSLSNKSGELAESEKEFFETWKQQRPLVNYSDSNLLAHVELDDTSGWQFANDALPQVTGKVNINLPPTIPRPKKVKGKDGHALTFDGKNFLSLGEIGDFDYFNDFSIGAWVKHTGNHRKTAGILSRRNGEQYRQGYDLCITPSNRITFRLIHNMNKEYLQVTSLSSIPKDTWKMVTVTYDGSGLASGVNIFINGSRQSLEVIRDSLENKSILNGNDFLVGNWNHRGRELSDLYGFKGGIVDKVRIWDKQLSALDIKMTFDKDQKYTPSSRELEEHYVLHYSVHQAQTKRSLDSLRRIDTNIPRVPIMVESDTIKPSYLLDRGQYDAHVKMVSRGVPKAVLTFDESSRHDRLGLANWLFAHENPLTSRVMVNRLWQMCFGRGIVSTPEDFGNQGSLPSHPELLDWLSVTFIEKDWDIKAMLRLMVTSGTYKQKANIKAKTYRKDPENIYLSRGPAKALTAEMIRDQALAASGLLNDRIGGKWVKPYQPAGIWKDLANQIGENKYRSDKGLSLYRRSLYTYWKRTIPPPTMLTFDAPERNICTVKRQETSTPLQALILLNDPTYIEASRVLAYHCLTDYPESSIGDLSAIIWETITSSPPDDSEVENLENYYEDLYQGFKENASETNKLLHVGAKKLPEYDDPEKLAALTMIASTVFNLDESKFN